MGEALLLLIPAYLGLYIQVVLRKTDGSNPNRPMTGQDYIFSLLRNGRGKPAVPPPIKRRGPTLTKRNATRRHGLYQAVH